MLLLFILLILLNVHFDDSIENLNLLLFMVNSIECSKFSDFAMSPSFAFPSNFKIHCFFQQGMPLNDNSISFLYHLESRCVVKC
jgi:hypothetical protein